MVLGTHSHLRLHWRITWKFVFRFPLGKFVGCFPVHHTIFRRRSWAPKTMGSRSSKKCKCILSEAEEDDNEIGAYGDKEHDVIDDDSSTDIEKWIEPCRRSGLDHDDCEENVFDDSDDDEFLGSGHSKRKKVMKQRRNGARLKRT